MTPRGQHGPVPTQRRRMAVASWTLGSLSAVLAVLGIATLIGAINGGAVLGAVMIVAAACGGSAVRTLNRLRARVPTAREREKSSVPVADSPAGTDDASLQQTGRPPKATTQIRWLPWFVALLWFLVGTLSEDAAVGVIAGIAGLAVGFLGLWAFGQGKKSQF